MIELLNNFMTNKNINTLVKMVGKKIYIQYVSFTDLILKSIEILKKYILKIDFWIFKLENAYIFPSTYYCNKVRTIEKKNCYKPLQAERKAYLLYLVLLDTKILI